MELHKELKKILPNDRLRLSLLDRYAFASDAGFYELIPLAVVQPATEEEISALFKLSQRMHVPLVFRTGGTSLSGQSITDGILVDLSIHWGKIAIESDGQKVRVQPGITGAMVNAHLKKHHAKIGPDPSSIGAAMMGGILSNNASGMCCGVKLNAYHTTQHIRFLLPNGNLYTTENPADYNLFENKETAICTALTNAKSEILANETLKTKIRKKYQTKNTVGYSLNALLDFEHPLDVFAHLLIGGEGTLAFISEAVLATTPVYAYKATGMLYFKDIFAACDAIVPLSTIGADMVELLDRASLRTTDGLAGIDPAIKDLPEPAAALLIEFQAETSQQLTQKKTAFESLLSGFGLLSQPVLSEEPAYQDFLWKIRKGLFPAVGAVRAAGSTVLLEDIAFPVEKLGPAIADLQLLFKKHNYPEAIVIAHAKDGNIHFVINQFFTSAKDEEKYDLFMQEIIELVVKKYDGALKAEHGTGRNMAPFVETEWGPELYAIMQQIKNAADPTNLLNPGVIINPDNKAHLKNIKKLPVVEAEVDKCIECGMCEPRCPSRDITMSPRRRIVARRQLKKLENTNQAAYKELLKDYQYQALDTCAVDGLCAGACPVDINTGDLVKRLRRENHSNFQNKVALLIAQNFKKVEILAKSTIKLGSKLNTIFGKKTMLNLTKPLNSVLGTPIWNMDIQPAKYTLKTDENADVVYFASCINRMMGGYAGKSKSGIDMFYEVAQKANINVKTVSSLAGTCCGQIFSSKGFQAAYEHTANATFEKLWLDSDAGRLPIVSDVSSCAYTLQNMKSALNEANRAHFDKLKFMDTIDFLYEFVLPKTSPKNKKQSIVLHPVCSSEKMKSAAKLEAIGRHFAVNVLVPLHAGCCGMAGDRGFSIPKLTAAATAKETKEVNQKAYDGYYSTTKTCEMALSTSTGQNYESILYLVAEGL